MTESDLKEWSKQVSKLFVDNSATMEQIGENIMIKQSIIEHEVMTIQNQVKNGVVSPYAMEILSEGSLKAGESYLNESYYMLDRPVLLGFKTPESKTGYEEKLENLFLTLKSIGFKDIRVKHFGDAGDFNFKLFQPHHKLFEIENVKEA